MKITNKHNLPENLVAALTFDPYERVGDISVTGLIKPPLMRQLELRHDNEIGVDVSTLTWRLMGRAIHLAISSSETPDDLAEEQLVGDYMGWKVGGRPDLLTASGTIVDYKSTSVFAFLLGDKPEWEAQLNCYSQLYRDYGFEPNRLQIVAFLRDHSLRKAMTESDYPKAPMYVADIPMWKDVATVEYIKSRVWLHQQSMSLDVKDIPPCSAKERWESPTIYAVKKKGNKIAAKGGKHQTIEQAEAFARTCSFPAEIEVRRGESTRCMHPEYCHGSRFCPFRDDFVGQDWRSGFAYTYSKDDARSEKEGGA